MLAKRDSPARRSRAPNPEPLDGLAQGDTQLVQHLLAVTEPGQCHSAGQIPILRVRSGDALLVQYLRDVPAVLQQRSLASGTLLMMQTPKP